MQKCIKKGSEKVCGCEEDFELEEDGKTCAKVHPCERVKQIACEQICIKDGPKAKCQCREGYELSEDGTTCEKGKL